jgi:hypothetical protein
MKHAAIVSIDLGSAYTKIGIRRGWDDEAKLVHGLPIALTGEADYCIPSVVARVERARGIRWLIGVDAANQIPGASVQIFRNWKAALFGGTDRASKRSAAREESIEVAVAFFKQLREILYERILTDVRHLPVRVAVPKLRDASGEDDLVIGILRQAGWEPATCRPTVFEPESNAIGFLSRGRNRTWIPPQQSFRPPSQRTIKMQPMLEPGLSTAFRTMADHYAVLVTDVGAFTTDFGFVKFDSSFRDDAWNRPAINQQSVALGIRQLDERVLGLLEPDVREYFAKRPTSEWEWRKQDLYAGKPQRIVVANKTITIGGEFELEAIQDEIRSFAERVCEARTDFLREHALWKVHEEAVTGGGSAIRTLRDNLVATIKDAKRRAHDLWDPREPDAATAAGAGRMTPREKELRVIANRTLVRGGSAVGGASVFFE